jgi:simple sugar transport system ATP-binding protein
MATLLQVKNLTKSFGSVIANNNISFEVNAGEIVALLGENGAGKSTLVKSVFGLLRPDQGEIYIDGKQMAPGDTAAVIASGVGMVHIHKY